MIKCNHTVVFCKYHSSVIGPAGLAEVAAASGTSGNSRTLVKTSATLNGSLLRVCFMDAEKLKQVVDRKVRAERLNSFTCHIVHLLTLGTGDLIFFMHLSLSLEALLQAFFAVGMQARE